MKFKVGDKVVVKRVQDLSDINESFDGYVGQVGTIYAVDEDWEYPYEVIFGDDEDSIEYLFTDDELELQNEEKTNTIYDGSMTLIDLCDCNDSYINIKFQEGAIADGVNGCTSVDVIDLLIDRLRGFQKGALPCQENDMAITKLTEAKLWLNERTRKRVEQGVEGKYENHG